MKISIKTTEKGIETNFLLEEKSTTTEQVALVIAELERIKLELINLLENTANYPIKLTKKGD